MPKVKRRRRITKQDRQSVTLASGIAKRGRTILCATPLGFGPVGIFVSTEQGTLFVGEFREAALEHNCELVEWPLCIVAIAEQGRCTRRNT